MRRKRRDIEDEGLEMRCRRVGSKRYGDLEACCGRVDVGVKRSGDLELSRRAVRVGTRRSLPQELWSSGGALQACRRRDVDVWSSGAFVPQGSLLPSGLRHLYRVKTGPAKVLAIISRTLR